MILNRSKTLSMRTLMRGIALPLVALTLANCAPVDDTIGTRLSLPPPSSEPRKPVDLDDIAIVGQVVAHAIMDLPAVANATTPPMVQFTGVTSIVKSRDEMLANVDTDAYTQLFRDRLLLVTREKLRFVERTLPPLVVTPKKGKGKKAATTPEVTSNPDYKILAELRGYYKEDLYKVEIQFVDAHTGEILFDGFYRIRKEAPGNSGDDIDSQNQPPPSAPAQPPPPPRTTDPLTKPTTDTSL